MFGVNGPKGEAAAPWMLCTDEIHKATNLIREARKIVKNMLNDHPFLANMAWSKNSVHLKWIEWLGFTFTGDKHISNGETFLWFGLRKAPPSINSRIKNGGTHV